MKLFMTLIFIFTITACGKKEDSAKPFSYTYNTYGSFTGKRVFLAHGNQGSGSDYLIPNSGLNTIHEGLLAKGYQVVLFSYPKTKTDTFRNASMNYRQEYEAFLNWMIDDVEAVHGVATETIFGGVSLGGLHTFMAVALNSKIDKWFAVLPVVEVTALSEFRHVNDSNFNALNEVNAIASKPGFILYDDTDTRVDWNLTVELIGELNTLNADLEVELRTGQGHAMTIETANKVLEWL